MTMKNVLKFVAFSAGFFTGGMLTGMLFSPKSGSENRKVISQKSKEASKWVSDKGKDVKQKSSKRVEQMKDTVPDLYKATENLNLSEEDLI